MAWSLVQDDAGNSVVVNVLTVTFSASATSGNLVIVNASISDGSNAITATCTVGGTAAAQAYRAHNASLAGGWTIWEFYLVLSASGSHACVVTFSEASANERGSIAEYSGNAASSVLDKTSTGTGSSTAPSSGNMTPDSNGQLIHGYCITQSGDIVAGSGFTGTQTVDDFDEPEYLEQGSAAAIDADWTAGNNQWVAGGATYRAPSGGDAVPVCWAQYRTRRN